MDSDINHIDADLVAQKLWLQIHWYFLIAAVCLSIVMSKFGPSLCIFRCCNERLFFD
jgi:hypothetical protein